MEEMLTLRASYKHDELLRVLTKAMDELGWSSPAEPARS